MFVPFSAVTDGVPRVREILREAEARRRAGGQRTILFCDEIHRFNKAQQDAFLPHVEAGTISLIGATTENPSFEVNGALLSRARVFVLEPLKEEHLERILRRALADAERGLGGRPPVDDDARPHRPQADGDARRALNALETAATLAVEGPSPWNGAGGAAAPVRRYDKGEGRALQPDLRAAQGGAGSDPQALYWLARMLDGGEDPLYIAAARASRSRTSGSRIPRRCRSPSPRGTRTTSSASRRRPRPRRGRSLPRRRPSQPAVHRDGQAMAAARETPPSRCRSNSEHADETHEELGYGRGYRYAFDSEDHYVPQEYLPERLGHDVLYASEFGFEKRIGERLAWWAGTATGGAGEGGPRRGAAPRQQEYRWKWTRATLFALVLAGVAAAGMPRIEEPKVRVAGVRLGAIGLEGGLLYVRLSVVNPNDFALEADGITYDVNLAEQTAEGRRWVDVTTGSFEERLRVGANDSTEVEIPVEFTYRGLGGAIRSIIGTGTVDYRVRGTIYLREPISTDIPYDHSGKVTVIGEN